MTHRAPRSGHHRAPRRRAGRQSWRASRAWPLAVAALLAGGPVLLTVGWLTREAARPSAVNVAAGEGGSAAQAAAGLAPDSSRPVAPHEASATGPLGFSVPVGVSVPAIGVTAAVLSLGENPDGTAAVPSMKTPQLTSWFDLGPAPGQTGPAAIYGHAATAAAGPAVFYRLRTLVPGDVIDVTRADHRIARFTVYRTAEYPKAAFPSMTVYGDTPDPELRLITCGGPFNQATASYPDNIVIYARLS